MKNYSQSLNTRDILNEYLYPGKYQDVRRKSFPYYDTVDLATGTMEYYFFTTALGNQFDRNKRLPLAGSEVFFIEAISAYIDLKISSTSLVNSLNEILQQSYLQISVDNRIVMKIPGLDFVNYLYSDSFADQVVVTAIQPRLGGNLNNDGFLGRKLPLPIIMNSTSAFEFKFVLPTAAATAFNGQDMKLVLHGLQLDKLDSFYWDNLKDAQFQKIPVTYYNTAVIPSNVEQSYELFADPAAAQSLHSQTFPLSDIQTFSLQNIEVFFNQPDTPIEPSTIWFNRLENFLKITVDDVDFYSANLQNMLSVFASFGATLTTTPDLDFVNMFNVRQSKTFPIPLEIPANSKVRIALTQPAASLGATGEFTVALRGIETRRVA